MDDSHITKFLSIKNKKFFNHLQNFEIIKKVLEESAPFIGSKNISLKGTTLNIILPTTKKQEVFLKKNKIIDKINTIAGKKIITDIK